MRAIKTCLAMFIACLLGTPSIVRADLLLFEDLFGVVSDLGIQSGPPVVSLGNVIFTSPDVTFNVGKDYGVPAGLGIPFTSDSLHLWTFGPGLVINFAQPITRVSFEAGVVTNQATFPIFELYASPSSAMVFGASLFSQTIVEASFDPPAQQLVVRFRDGSSSLLGIDNFEFTFVPEPSQYFLMAIFGATVLRAASVRRT